GGRADFVTPDGRRLELTLHSQDWPFMTDRDALILLLQDTAQNTTLASAWAEIDSDDIAIDLGWLHIQCGSMVPNTDDLWTFHGVRPPPERDRQGDPRSVAALRAGRNPPWQGY